MTTLKSLKRDAETLNILPKAILSDINKLIDKLDVEMGQ